MRVFFSAELIFTVQSVHDLAENTWKCTINLSAFMKQHNNYANYVIPQKLF